MPAFTFEKITPPVRRGSVPSSSGSSNSPAANSPAVNSTIVNSNSVKHRSVFVQIIGRLVEVRTRRTLRAEPGTLVRRDPKPRT